MITNNTVLKRGKNESDGNWYELVKQENLDVFKFKILDGDGRVVNMFKRKVEAEREFDLMVDWTI